MAISMKRISNFIYLDSMRLNYILNLYDIMAAIKYNCETNRINISITYIKVRRGNLSNNRYSACPSHDLNLVNL
jgi:hypothetical protein